MEKEVDRVRKRLSRVRQWPFVFAFTLSHAGSAPAPLLGAEAALVHHPMCTYNCMRRTCCTYVYLATIIIMTGRNFTS